MARSRGAALPPLLLANRNFQLVWAGEGVSVLGSATTTVLLPLLAITAYDAGPGWLGLLTAAMWAPWLVLGLPVGAWVDTRDPRRILITSDLVSAVALGSIPVAWSLRVLSLPQLVAVALVTGSASVFFRAAHPRLLTAVVPPAELERANSTLVSTESAMDIAGPGVGGVLAQLFSAAWGMGLDALTFLVSAVCLWRTRSPAAPVETHQHEPLLLRIRAGLRLVYRDGLLRYFVVQGGLSNLGLAGSSTLLVLFLVRDCDLDPAAVGAVLMLGSVGGVVGAAVAPQLSRSLGSARAVVLLTLVGGPPAFLVVLSGPGPAGVALVVAGSVLVSFGVMGENVVRGAWRQRYIPAHLLGRAVTTSQMVNYGTLPIAGLLAGWLGTALGLRTAMGVLVAVHALAALSILLTPLRRARDLPAAP